MVGGERATAGASASGRQGGSRARPSPVVVGRVLAGISAAALVVLLIGGYELGWSWTGFGDNDHLWDYLQLLVLPIALATLPIYLRTRRPDDTRWTWIVVAVLAIFAGLLVGGYPLSWEWTGFGVKTLWDWLDLLILPIVVMLLPLWLETHERLESRWIALLTSVLVGFVVLVVGGYALGWAWTGFPGNTVWDWIHLLLVPFALPAALTWYQLSGRRYREQNRADVHVDDEAPGASLGASG